MLTQGYLFRKGRIEKVGRGALKEAEDNGGVEKDSGKPRAWSWIIYPCDDMAGDNVTSAVVYSASLAAYAVRHVGSDFHMFWCSVCAYPPADAHDNGGTCASPSTSSRESASDEGAECVFLSSGRLSRCGSPLHQGSK